MDPVISVIVPVYKSEKYLEKCLDSLTAQTLHDIEILLVDDGSPDRSGEICDRYAEADNRVRVIHQENQGVSAARNAGIEASRGEYIMFVDSDDWVEADYCRIPYEAAVEHHADQVMFKYVWVEKGRPPEQQKDHEEGIYTRREAFQLIEEGVGTGPTNKLYKKTLFEQIRFPAGRRFEDIIVVPKLVQSSDRIYYLNIPLYYYRAADDSASHTSSHKANKDMFEMSMERIRLLEKWGYTGLADISWKWPCWTYLVREGRHGEHSAEAMEYIRRIPGGADNFPGMKKIMYLLLLKAPVLFDGMCILSGRRAKE